MRGTRRDGRKNNIIVDIICTFVQLNKIRGFLKEGGGREHLISLFFAHNRKLEWCQNQMFIGNVTVNKSMRETITCFYRIKYFFDRLVCFCLEAKKKKKHTLVEYPIYPLDLCFKFLC